MSNDVKCPIVIFIIFIMVVIWVIIIAIWIMIIIVIWVTIMYAMPGWPPILADAFEGRRTWQSVLAMQRWALLLLYLLLLPIGHT